MTPEERKTIIERAWTYPEACAALQSIRNLLSEGMWGNFPPTERMVELAKAYETTPAGILNVFQLKVIDAFEMRIRGYDQLRALRKSLKA